MRISDISPQLNIMQTLLDGLAARPWETAGMCGSWSVFEMVADDLSSDFFFWKISSGMLLL